MILKAHLRYLWYVLLHKLYVARAGVAIRGWSPRWLWRLLVHDLSTFSRAEWSPYVRTFYGPRLEGMAAQNLKGAYQRARLHHQHANPHHWQHWILREDSGATIILLMPADVLDEMIADWLGAGSKVLNWPSFRDCVKETIVWYAANREKILLREIARNRVEHVLMSLADDYGLVGEALALHTAQAARESLVIPGRS